REDFRTNCPEPAEIEAVAGMGEVDEVLQFGVVREPSADDIPRLSNQRGTEARDGGCPYCPNSGGSLVQRRKAEDQYRTPVMLNDTNLRRLGNGHGEAVPVVRVAGSCPEFPGICCAEIGGNVFQVVHLEFANDVTGSHIHAATPSVAVEAVERRSCFRLPLPTLTPDCAS